MLVRKLRSGQTLTIGGQTLKLRYARGGEACFVLGPTPAAAAPTEATSSPDSSANPTDKT